MSVILPVKWFCTVCGWAYSRDDSSKCRRCGHQKTESLSLYEPPEDFLDPISEPLMLKSAIFDKPFGPPPLMSPSPKAYPREHGIALPHQLSPRGFEELEQKDIGKICAPKFQNVCKPFKRFRSMSKSNRMSRAYSRQFLASVNFGEGPSDHLVNARPLVNNIVNLVEKCYESKDSSGYEEMQLLLRTERQKGTPWQEIADETIMELIINELRIFYFAKALIKAYNVSTYDFGNFISAPPDKGTMSLIEEAVCHNSMTLFVDLLQMGDVLSGVLESKDVPAEAQEKILLLLNQS